MGALADIHDKLLSSLPVALEFPGYHQPCITVKNQNCIVQIKCIGSTDCKIILLKNERYEWCNHDVAWKFDYDFSGFEWLTPGKNKIEFHCFSYFRCDGYHRLHKSDFDFNLICRFENLKDFAKFYEKKAREPVREAFRGVKVLAKLVFEYMGLSYSVSNFRPIKSTKSPQQWRALSSG